MAKIYHLGGVEIGDSVEIGANSAIDRGVLGNTQLEDGVKLDNHVHVAHNVRLGANTAVAAQTAFAGSVNVGANCQIAGHVGVTGHLSIADGVTVLANTLVTKSINKPGVYSGIMPMMEHNESLKFVAKLKRKVNREQIKSVLPHREPFLFLDEIVSVNSEEVVAKKMCQLKRIIFAVIFQTFLSCQEF